VDCVSHSSLFSIVLTPLAPRSKSQRGKASPKTSRGRGNGATRLDCAHFTSHEHLGTVPRMRTPDNQSFTIVQTSGNTILQQSGSFAYGALSTKFSDLSQNAQLAYVFDQYRIEEVQHTFRPMFTANQLPSSSTFYLPMLYVVIDYDDIATLTPAYFYQAYANCNTSMCETVSVTYRPHIAMAAYGGSTFTAYANQSNQWIDCSSSSVPHYGVKYGCDAGGAGQTSFQSFVISTRIRISFKNVR
jgi:hypothetical protein